MDVIFFRFFFLNFFIFYFEPTVFWLTRKFFAVIFIII